MKTFFTLAAERLSFEELDQIALASGQPSREEMLKEYRAGTRQDVTFPARVYVHGPNKNHVNLDEAELESFAKSFAGLPFLKDHSRKQDDRGGTILASRLEERGGRKVMIQTIKATKPWAVEGYLDETIDRFSIGWNADEYICTVCDTSFFDEDEKHTIWDIGTVDKKTGKTVEVLMKGLEGMETSTVTHPAVRGTGTDEVLSQLQQLMDSNASGEQFRSAKATKPMEISMLQKLLSLLGLSADTAEPEALAALETRLKAPSKPPVGLLSALGLGAEATTDEAIARVYAFNVTHVLRSEFDRVAKELAESKADVLVRKYEDEKKVTPANREWARSLAASNPAEFERIMKDFPVQGPEIGAPKPKTGIPNPASGVLTAEEEAVRRTGNLTVEQFIAARPRARVN